jgi:hypothetical protein
MKEDTVTLSVVKDFGDKPYGRYMDVNNKLSGEQFRKELLVPNLRAHRYVHVDLDGYNRYGRSFLDEAFGGLIRDEGFKWADLKMRLTYSHSLVKSIENLIEDRLEAARQSVEGMGQE